MIRYPTLPEILALHRQVMESSGGAIGVLSLEGLEFALAQPRLTFEGKDAYSSLPAKASAPGFSLVKNHSFVDGNKRTGHAAVEVFLLLNGYELEAPVDEQKRVMWQLASGDVNREAFTKWIHTHIVAKR